MHFDICYCPSTIQVGKEQSYQWIRTHRQFKNNNKEKQTKPNTNNNQTHAILGGYSKNAISDHAQGQPGGHLLRKITSMGLDASAVGLRV